METKQENNESSQKSNNEENSVKSEEDYDNIECSEEKLQPITSSILLNSLKQNPLPTPSSPQLSGSNLSKGKRRSKNVVEGRVFKCQQCDKTYLSYPALYTHMKTKHSVPLQDSQTATGRTRGRPKKSKPSVKDSDPSTFEFFTETHRAGETTDIISRFTESFEDLTKTGMLSTYKNIQNYSLFSKIGQKLSLDNIQTCDEVFAKYLEEVALKVNETYFKLISKFVMMYRECLNKYGWLKFFENSAPQIESEEQKQTENNTPKVTRQILLTGDQVEKMKEEYSAVNNAEFLPEVANEFILLFLPENSMPGLDSKECTNLVINMTEWMFTNGFTCTKVSILKK